MVLRLPVRVSAGRGGFVPVLVLGGLFGWIGWRAGIAVMPAAAVGALGGTVSLLAHELGHALAAKRANGIRPMRISLVSLGAVTYLEGRYARGMDKARVAAAGPLASLTLAAGVAPWALLPLGHAGRALVLAVAVLNVLLAVVNLLPVRGLDGQNVLIGVVWSIVGTESSAAALVRRAGLALVLLVTLVIVPFAVARPGLGTTAAAITGCLVCQSVYARRRALPA